MGVCRVQTPRTEGDVFNVLKSTEIRHLIVTSSPWAVTLIWYQEGGFLWQKCPGEFCCKVNLWGNVQVLCLGVFQGGFFQVGNDYEDLLGSVSGWRCKITSLCV